MNEISLNILDIAQNSLRAEAETVYISVEIDECGDTLKVGIHDDGFGMPAEFLSTVTDPFKTTRTTRKVGLGISLFKMAAEMTGGSFAIHSAQKGGGNTEAVNICGKPHGTSTEATFVLSHIDRMPLGDMCSTIEILISDVDTSLNHSGKQTDFVYSLSIRDNEGEKRRFSLDTREIKELLETDSLDIPEIKQFISEFLSENTQECTLGKQY